VRCAAWRIGDRTGDIWFAELKDHKMAHKGKSRVLVFGPKAQEILKRYFVRDLNRRLFPIRRQTVSDNIKRACEVAFGMPEGLRKKKLNDEEPW
jgi:succinylglutamate desuccinylase